MDSIGVKRLNTGVGITVADFAATSCFFILDRTPEMCNNAHLHSKLMLYIFLSFKIKLTYFYFFYVVTKNGTIGVEMTFKTPTDAAYQLLTYAIYPKSALLDQYGNCILVDNI